MKATPTTPSGIPKGHVGPLYPANGTLTTFNHGTSSRNDMVYERPRRGIYQDLHDYVRTREDHK